MNKVRKIFTVALLAASSAAMAQATYVDRNGNEYMFQQHFFVQGQIGAQHTVGETNFFDLISPNAQLGVGYQFTPWFATRLAASAWQSKGAYNGVMSYSWSETVVYQYKYIAPGLDFMFNLSNIAYDWTPDRKWNVNAFVGVGANIAWGNDEEKALYDAGYEFGHHWEGTKVLPVGRFGLGVDYQVTKDFALGIEANANFLSDKYNSKKAGNADWYFNALVGIKYNLGRTSRKVNRPVEQPVPAPAPAPAPAPVPEPVVEEIVVEEVVKVEPIRRDIFFDINKTAVTANQVQKVKDIADYMKKYPESTVKIAGYADAGTGNNTINDKLAAQRSASVVKMLVETYGISRSRISSDSHGSHIQPFADNDSNRVTICIAE